MIASLESLSGSQREERYFLKKLKLSKTLILALTIDSMAILEIKNLKVKVENRIVLNGVSLSLKRGEIHAIFGPNGSGKTSLISSIIGIPSYKIIEGRITFDGKDITRLPIYERAKLGIFCAFQNPPSIRGLKVKDFIKLFTDDGKNVLEFSGLNSNFLEREVNVGFSGGERKKFEVAQIFAIKPKLLLLDEIDSGVDVESLKFIGKKLAEYIQKNKISVLVVTHHGEILNYLKPSKASVMLNGEIVCSGDYKKIWKTIREKGYEWCEKCKLRKK
jgi:Fe-S cluster assembly ATP-binding protein